MKNAAFNTTPIGFYVLCSFNAEGKQLGRQKFVVQR
jgi:hypothetical protein